MRLTKEFVTGYLRRIDETGVFLYILPTAEGVVLQSVLRPMHGLSGLLHPVLDIHLRLPLAM